MHSYDILIVLAAALCTLATRAFPFVLFGGNKKPPHIITYLGKVLPGAVIAILVVYCLRGIHFETASGFLPSIIAVAVTAALHIWKRNNLISIGGGTILYMILVQMIFV
jgi:branched-subunit amino acid transport protein AzlD